METLRGDGVIIQYERSLQAVAKEVRKLYRTVRGELEGTLGWKADFTPKVVLIKDSEAFRAMTGSDQIVAVAVSNDNLIIIDNSRMKTHPFTLEITLKHELCHLMLHRHVGRAHLPKWLNEGVSQWVSGGIAELIIGENRDLLKQATLSGTLMPLEELSRGFPAEGRKLSLAYQQSRDIVEYVDSRYGPEGIRRILEYLSEGEAIDSAMMRAVSISAARLETEWHDHLKRRYTWFMYLSSRLYQILFSFAALVLVYGFIKLLLKKRAYKDEEDDEDLQ